MASYFLHSSITFGRVKILRSLWPFASSIYIMFLEKLKSARFRVLASCGLIPVANWSLKITGTVYSSRGLLSA